MGDVSVSIFYIQSIAPKKFCIVAESTDSIIRWSRPMRSLLRKGSRHVLGRDVTDAYRLKHRCPPVHTKHRQYGSHPLHLTASDQNIRNFKNILLLPKSSRLHAVLFTWKISGYKTTYYPLEQRFLMLFSPIVNSVYLRMYKLSDFKGFLHLCRRLSFFYVSMLILN